MDSQTKLLHNKRLQPTRLRRAAEAQRYPAYAAMSSEPNNFVEAFKEVANPILARQHGVRALGADGLHPAVS